MAVRPDTMPILVIRDRSTKAYAATEISKTRVDQYAVQFLVGFTRELGWRRYISMSDDENSLVALKNIVRDATSYVEMIPKESTVGDHAANAEAENACSGISSNSHVDTATRCKLSSEMSLRTERSEPRSGLQSPMIEGRHVGHYSRAESILAMTNEGIVRGRDFNRIWTEERSDLVEFENLKGTPRQLKEPRAVVVR